MKVFRTISEYKKWRGSLPQNCTIGFVPTMGFLHKGHLSLVEEAIKKADYSVVSIFVNPIQFNNARDLKNYPRDEKSDLEKLEKIGADAVFIPIVEEMYPQKVEKTYSFPGLDDIMEGAKRPGHFNGVAIVVSLLFEIIEPQFAFFGKKDYQQFLIVKELARREFPNLEIIGLPIAREQDGLAMSSRNTLLTADERKIAPQIFKLLKHSADLLNTLSIEAICRYCTNKLAHTKYFNPEYFIIADAETLAPIKEKSDTKHAIAFVATWLGNVRLIDNYELF